MDETHSQLWSWSGILQVINLNVQIITRCNQMDVCLTYHYFQGNYWLFRFHTVRFLFNLPIFYMKTSRNPTLCTLDLLKDFTLYIFHFVLLYFSLKHHETLHFAPWICWGNPHCTIFFFISPFLHQNFKKSYTVYRGFYWRIVGLLALKIWQLTISNALPI